MIYGDRENVAIILSDERTRAVYKYRKKLSLCPASTDTHTYTAAALRRFVQLLPFEIAETLVNHKQQRSV